MIWIARHPQAQPEMLGYLPDIFSDGDPRSAVEQVNDRYRNGGGWRPFKGFRMDSTNQLRFPGDPPMRPIYESILHAETSKPEIIRFYESAWVAIIQVDGSYEVSRMD